MKYRIKKKQLRRLWEATAHYLQGLDFEEFHPAKKPLTGKAARRLVGANYRALDSYGCGWRFCDRPKFCSARKYIILAEQDEQDRDEWLRIVRAEDAQRWPAGMFERCLDP